MASAPPSGMRPSHLHRRGIIAGGPAFDRRHILNINAVYELPFGRGRRFAHGSASGRKQLLGGWQLSGIYGFIRLAAEHICTGRHAGQWPRHARQHRR